MAKTKKESTYFESITKVLAEQSDFCFVMGDDDSLEQLKSSYHYRTGISVIDMILGEGGFGSGRMSEVYGVNRSGKSELAQCTVAQFLEDFPDGIAVLFDEETALDDKKLAQWPIFSSSKRLIVKKSASMEDGFNSVIKMLKILIKDSIKVPVLIVFDSVAAMPTKEETEVDLGKKVIGAQARVLSEALRKVRGLLRQTNAHAMFVNQTRNKIGGMGGSDSACGEALKFYADYRLKLTNIGSYRFVTGGEPAGFKIEVKTTKNKRVSPLRVVQVPLLFNRVGEARSGLSEAWSMYDMLRDKKLSRAAGGKISIPGTEFKSFEKKDWPALLREHRQGLGETIEKLRQLIMSEVAQLEEDEEDDEMPPKKPNTEE